MKNAEPTTTKIRIRIVDKENRPAPNLKVTASYKEASAESDTDGQGRVNFPQVPVPSDVNILIALSNQDPFEKCIVCQKKDEEHVMTLPFTFRSTAMMRFQIADSEGKGLKKIPLRLECKGMSAEDVTDKEGRSEFSDIPVGEKVRLSVKHSKKEPLVKNFRCNQQEELHQIVIDIPKKNYKPLLILPCLFLLIGAGFLSWWLTGDDEPNIPSVPPSALILEECRCKDEIEELRQEIRRVKKEIAEIRMKGED